MVCYNLQVLSTYYISDLGSSIRASAVNVEEETFIPMRFFFFLSEVLKVWEDAALFYSIVYEVVEAVASIIYFGIS